MDRPEPPTDHEPTPGEPAAPPAPPPGGAPHPHRTGSHSLRESVEEAFEGAYEAAIEAELATGRRERTEAEARRGVLVRLLRIVGGFTLIGVGIAGLALPGPGWVIIIVGLGLLPYAWAERTVRAIRRRVPGIPEDGRIPTSSWIVMGVLVAGAAAVSILWGAAITDWVSGLWGDPEKLLL